MPTYIIDSGIWIHIEKYHRHDVFKKFWSQLDNSIGDGSIITPQEVLDEVETGTMSPVPIGPLLKARNGLIIPLDQPLMNEVTNVLSGCPTLIDPDSEKNGADPFVVALAKLRGGVVVTTEKPRKSPNGKMKVPDACSHFKISCLDWYGFLLDVKWDL